MAGVAFGLIFAFLMGVASIFSRLGLENGSAKALVVISLSISSPTFLIISYLTTGFSNTPALGVLFAGLSGVAGSVLGRVLYFLGINYLGPGKSLSIIATSPIYAGIFAWLFLGESITPLVLGGTIGIILGIVSISKDIRTQVSIDTHSPYVVFYPFAGAFLGAIAVILRKFALNVGTSPFEAASINMTAGLVLVTPLALTRWKSEVVQLNRTSLVNFFAASIIMTIGFAFYFVGLQSVQANVFFPLVQTQPLFAVVLSALFIRRLELISLWTVLGTTIIVVGAALIVVG